MPKETAEQKLLRLIEATEAARSGGGQPPAEGQPAADGQSPEQQAQQTQAAVKGSGLSLTLPPFLKKMFPSKGDPSEPVSLGLRELNRGLGVAIAVLAVFFSIDFSRNLQASKEEVRFDFHKRPLKETDGVLPQFRDMSEYVTVVSTRNILQPIEKKVVEQAESEELKEEAPAVQKVVEKTKNFKLVGISWQGGPDSVVAMVEDQKTSVTHFLKQGDEVKGLQVQKINADSVIFSYQGETHMINL